MIVIKKNLIFIILLLLSTIVLGQSFHLKKNVDKQVVKFKLVNNLIIIPVELNGVKLSFILDSGVNKPIVFNLTQTDSVEIKNPEEIYLKGLGSGSPIRAYKAEGNRFKIGDNVYNNNQLLYLVLDQGINLSSRIGFPVHGIIGYDIFRDFVVEIKYASKKMVLHNPKSYKYRKNNKYNILPIEVKKNKSFIKAAVVLHDKKEEVELLIDSGSSDALWLFENTSDAIKVPPKYFEDFLGKGLSGSVYGKRGHAKMFIMADYTLEEAKVAFPDSLSLLHLTNLGERNGSIGGEILKRFNVIFDYKKKQISLKKNSYFKEPFKYNMSGIELQQNGLRFVKELESNFLGIARQDNSAQGEIKVLLTDNVKLALHPAIEIAEIRDLSPAHQVGLKIGDILLSVNGKKTHLYSLQEISEMINDKPGKRIKLMVDRKGRELVFAFQLKKILQ